MTTSKKGEEVAAVLNSCFWSDDLVDPRGSPMSSNESFEREQLRQEIIDHLGGDAMLAITITLAQESLSRIKDAYTQVTKLREAAQNTLTTIDRTREDTDRTVGQFG